MKAKCHLIAASIATLALVGSAEARQNERQSAAEARGSSSARVATSDDDASFAWRVARYPGRVGHTIVRSPMIVGETLGGERTFMSERGFFQTKETKYDSLDKESTPERRSIPQGRGQRIPR